MLADSRYVSKLGASDLILRERDGRCIVYLKQYRLRVGKAELGRYIAQVQELVERHRCRKDLGSRR